MDEPYRWCIVFKSNNNYYLTGSVGFVRGTNTFNNRNDARILVKELNKHQARSIHYQIIDYWLCYYENGTIFKKH